MPNNLAQVRRPCKGDNGVHRWANSKPQIVIPRDHDEILQTRIARCGDAMSAFCAACDWGTSSFRLWVLDKTGAVLGERRSDEGLLSVDGQFEAVLEGHLAALGAADDLPVVICGMAGAQSGWQEAAYLSAPCSLRDVPAAAMRVQGATRDVRILPGISQADPADVMRGEETQLLGLGREGIICLPGTHSKWAVIEQGRVTQFSTWMTGELFALLSKHSILAATVVGEAAPDETFRAALNEAFDMPEALTNRLFGLRAKALLGQDGGGASALSGYLIGLELVGVGPADEVTLVASGPLGELYAAALDELATPFTKVDATATTQAGLFAAATEIWKTEAL